MNTDIGQFGLQYLKSGCAGTISNSDLKEIKQMLLSGDKERILQSIEKIKLYLRTEESIFNLIRSDISEFLCDAMAPFDGITFRFNMFAVTPEKESIESMLQLMPTLLNTTYITVQNKYQIGCIMLNFADFSRNIWNDEMYEALADSFSKWIDLITDVFVSEHPLKDNMIFLCCFLCHFMFKSVISSLNSAHHLCGTQTTAYSKDELINKICNFLIHTEAPYLDTLSLTVIENDPLKVEYFFQIILYFYSDKVLPQKNYITHGLGEVGFLQFVTRVISFVNFGNSEQLRKLGVLVLTHTVLSLSEDVFQISKIWSDGLQDFHNQIQRGFEELPLDASQWLDVLVDSESLGSSKIALLLYLYFYCMTAKSQSIIATIYPAIVTFIYFSSGLETSALLAKVVWFIFVISQLSCTQTPRPNIEMESTNKMIAILEAHDNLELIYTHHPALLYWVFSTEISSTLQSKTDILQNDCGDVLDLAFSTLHSAVKESEDDNLVANVWFLLPQVLAKFTIDSTSAKNLDYMIELCSLKTPEIVDMTKVIRIATLLPEVLTKSDMISVVPSLTLIFRLLDLAQKMDDMRVVQIILQFDLFVQKIVAGLQSNVFEISVLSLKIFTSLWENGKGTDRKKIKIRKELVLSVLDSEFIEVVAAGLGLLYALLVSEFSSSFFVLDDVDLHFVEILFFQVQNVCMKSDPNLIALCWRCLAQFLLFEGSDGWDGKFKHIEFTSDPFMHELINFHLPCWRDLTEMKEFLNVWLDQNNRMMNDSCCGRKIYGGYFRETIQNVGHQLCKDPKEEDKILYEKKGRGKG
ncbi:hypothetical protein RUM43_005289 [Polyplax serrata]|uniref:Uncharacterized protein n=1 Tax=Polyplax serrata TaxID=468196 RepID=A0AAN8S1D2_POLSC